jgi:hypothetical protein
VVPRVLFLKNTRLKAVFLALGRFFVASKPLQKIILKGSSFNVIVRQGF